MNSDAETPTKEAAAPMPTVLQCILYFSIIFSIRLFILFGVCVCVCVHIMRALVVALGIKCIEMA